MSLVYARDKYKKLSEDILDGTIDINDEKNRQYLYKELKVLGESNVENRIKNISKYNKDKSEKANLIKDIIREVNGENKSEIEVISKSEFTKKELSDKNERKISTDKPFKESGYLDICIKNYDRCDKYENISKFIKKEGKHINFNVKNLNFEENKLNLRIEYTINFNKKTKPGEYKESIEITFKDVESIIYEFFISCDEENNKVYNFKFKDIDELYSIFKFDIENNYKNILEIFNHKDFENYLRYIKEYEALDLYKNFNLRTYKLENLNLFFTTLGYEQCNIQINQQKIDKGLEKRINQVEENIDLMFLTFYHIENIDDNFKIKIYSNRNKDIKIKRIIDLIPYKVQILLKKILKEKVEKFNSYIMILDRNILKHIFKYFIKKEYIGKSFMVLISTEKSQNELNLYTLRIHI